MSFLCPGRFVYNVFTPGGRILEYMADFLAVLGVILFVAVMLGLIWCLERV